MTKQKEKGYQEIEAIDDNLSTKIQDVTTSVSVTEKNEKQYFRLQL